MRRVRALVVLAGLAACDRSPAARGAEVFRDPSLSGSDGVFSCATCHAADEPVADRILPGAPMAGVVGRPTYWGEVEVDLLPSINHCVEEMMGRDAPLAATDEEAVWLWAFLESLPGSAEPVSFTVPQEPDVPSAGGTAAEGEIVFERACASCHGGLHDGEGRSSEGIPVLPEETIAAHPEPEYDAWDRRVVFAQKTRHGRYFGYGGRMPPFSLEVLSDAELGHLLVAFGL